MLTLALQPVRHLNGKITKYQIGHFRLDFFLPNFSAIDADTDGTQAIWTPEYHPGADANNNNLNATIDSAVLPDRKTELWAKYYFPNNLSGGPYPVVVLHHGNHNTCGYGSNPRIDNNSRYTNEGQCVTGPDPSGVTRDYVTAPSHRGYDYLATKLASHGYIVVSINSNRGITGSAVPYLNTDNPNFPEFTDDATLMLARGRLVLKHLQKLSEWNAGVATLASSTTLSSSTKTGETGWFGTKIQVGSSPLLVRSIGRIYLNGNSGTHTLRIVRASDSAVVATSSVTMNNWNHGQYKYSDLSSPITLAANTIYYLVSQEQSGGDKFARAEVTSSSVARVYLGGVRSFNGTTWKNIGGNPYNFGVDLRYETVSTTPTELGVNLKGKIDFSNIGLMGHSRGGEGMRAAYELYRESNSPWQSRILSPMTVKGIFEFAPSDRFVLDRDGNVIRLLNADGTAWNVVLPACDGDLYYLPGVKPFDRMQKLSSETPAKPKSTYYVYGANHNYYNTQWQLTDSFNTTTDLNGCIGPANNPLFLNPVSDGAGGFGSANQRRTGSSPFMAFMRGNVGSSANSTFNQNFDPKFLVPSNVSSITRIERSFTASPNPSQTLIFQDLEFTPLNTNICFQSGITCNGSGLQALSSNVQVRTDSSPFVPPNTMNHDEDFLAASLSWSSPSPLNYFQTSWSGTSIDVSSYQNLDFRISRRRNRISPQQLDALNASNISNFSVQLLMENGTISNAVTLSKYLSRDGPVGKTDQTISAVVAIGELHPILRTVRIPLSDFVSSDLTKIKAVRFIFNDTSKGAVNLSNLRFSK